MKVKMKKLVFLTVYILGGLAVQSAPARTQTQWYPVIRCQGSLGKKLTFDTNSRETGISEGARGRYENGATVVEFVAEKVSKLYDRNPAFVEHFFLANGRITFATGNATTPGGTPVRVGDKVTEIRLYKPERSVGRTVYEVGVSGQSPELERRTRDLPKAYQSETLFTASQCKFTNLDKIHY
jgi:hypothetical protein